MKTKIVYVLVSSSQDIYLEQAYISMFSIKYYMPDAHIVLLTDKQTESTFTNIRKNELKYADEIISIHIPNTYTAQQRSRILKTSARKHIKGDFLFIDTDTIIVKPLDEIDSIEADIAACWDSHAPFKENPYRSMCVEHGHMLKWPIEQETTYFNSGVIYVKDNEITHKFYELWHKNWIDGCNHKVYMDQPAFAKTNYILGHPIKTLDDIWNCELKHGIRYLKDAKIVHYLCTNISKKNDRQVFLLNEREIFQEILKNNGEIPSIIKEVIIDPFKGIAPITHLFAGNDLSFFQSNYFTLIYKIRNSLFEKCINNLIEVYKFIKRYI